MRLPEPVWVHGGIQLVMYTLLAATRLLLLAILLFGVR
jgi:hypothetical protein